MPTWEYCNLEAAVKKASSNLSLNKIANEEGEYPVFGAKGFVTNISFYHQEEEYLAIIKDGAGIGRVSKHPSKSSILATMQYLVPNEAFDIDFIRYFLMGVDFQEYRTGSTIPHIYFKDYKSLRLPDISIPEQQRIVAILDQAFADIEKARANAEKNLKNARELFDSYLNQVFSQRGEGWVETLLEDVCGFKHGFAFKSEYFTQESNLVLLTPGNFFEEGGYRDRGSKQKYYKGPFPKEFLLSKGCLLVAMTEQAAGLLGSSIVVPEENTFLHNQRLGLVQLTEAWKENISLEFLSQLFNAHYFRAKVQETGSGLKVRHTSPKKLQAITVWIPKAKDEQCKIVNDIAHLKKETIRLELVYKNKLSSLDELKKSLLQKAFSGELTKSKGIAA